jgi:hypothetical protein
MTIKLRTSRMVPALDMKARICCYRLAVSTGLQASELDPENGEGGNWPRRIGV